MSSDGYNICKQYTNTFLIQRKTTWVRAKWTNFQGFFLKQIKKHCCFLQKHSNSGGYFYSNVNVPQPTIPTCSSKQSFQMNASVHISYKYYKPMWEGEREIKWKKLPQAFNCGCDLNEISIKCLSSKKSICCCRNS